MKLVLITIALLVAAVLVTYLIIEEKKQTKEEEQAKENECEIQQNLASETAVTIPESSKMQDKPKRKYTKKTNKTNTNKKTSK